MNREIQDYITYNHMFRGADVLSMFVMDGILQNKDYAEMVLNDPAAITTIFQRDNIGITIDGTAKTYANSYGKDMISLIDSYGYGDLAFNNYLKARGLTTKQTLIETAKDTASVTKILEDATALNCLQHWMPNALSVVIAENAGNETIMTKVCKMPKLAERIAKDKALSTLIAANNIGLMVWANNAQYMSYSAPMLSAAVKTAEMRTAISKGNSLVPSWVNEAITGGKYFTRSGWFKIFSGGGAYRCTPIGRYEQTTKDSAHANQSLFVIKRAAINTGSSANISVSHLQTLKVAAETIITRGGDVVNENDTTNGEAFGCVCVGGMAIDNSYPGAYVYGYAYYAK